MTFYETINVIKETFQGIYQAETCEQFKILLKKSYFGLLIAALKLLSKRLIPLKNYWDGVL